MYVIEGAVSGYQLNTQSAVRLRIQVLELELDSVYALMIDHDSNPPLVSSSVILIILA